jgi:hypothetical protein
MGLGEILDRTVNIYRARFTEFMKIAALPTAAMLALFSVNDVWWRIYPSRYLRPIVFGINSQQILYMLVIYQVSLLFHLVVWPALVLATSRACFEEPIGPWQALSASFARWRSWIGLVLAHWVLVLVSLEIAGFGILAGTYALLERLGIGWMDEYGRQMFAGFTALISIVFAILSASLCLTFPVWAIEGKSVWRAMRRGWILSKSGRSKILLSRCAVGFVAWIITGVFSWVFKVAFFMILRGSPLWFQYSSLVFDDLDRLVNATIGLLATPIFPIAMTLLYYDQRVRKEGFDIELLMSAAGMDVAPVVAEGDPTDSALGTSEPLV